MNYKEFVSKLKSGIVYRAGGEFNSSTIISVALINKVCEKEMLDYPIVKNLYNEHDGITLEKNNIVLGMENGTFSRKVENTREDGTPISTLGKIFNVVGYELYGDCAKYLDKAFISEMDITNGSSLTNPYVEMLEKMKPCWNEKFTRNQAFDNAVRIAEQGLSERYEELTLNGSKNLTELISEVEKDIEKNREHSINKSTEKAKRIIKDLVNNTEPVYGGYILHFSKPGITKDLIENSTKENILGYSYPNDKGITFKPINLEVPEEWLGIKEEDPDLGITYCNKAGTTINFKDEDSLMDAIDIMTKEKDYEINLNDEYFEDMELA